MNPKLQQAISIIKSGDKQNGQKILAEILKDEPQNEQAWLWLSATVPADKRAFCLEKVLSINPNNETARQALASLSMSTDTPSQASAPSPHEEDRPAETSAVREEPAPSNWQPAPSVDARVVPSFRPETWVYVDRRAVNVAILSPQNLIVGKSSLLRKKSILEKIQQGLIPDDLLDTKVVVPVGNISEITMIMSSVRVYYQSKDSPRSSVSVECQDRKMAEGVLKTMKDRFGNRLKETVEPMGRCSIIGVSGFFMAIVTAGTAFFYWGALEAANETATGSARTRAILRLLELLGPNGVLCIGGFLFLVCLGLMVYWFAKPPMVTKLVDPHMQPERGGKR